ncbi:MAG: TonB-dependent receptor [Cyclobacteriaceae bacterium]|nr:TonB-dependent receptor [Cyclobacteriaceae bacterium]
MKLYINILFILICPMAVHAQDIQGKLFDKQTGKPVSGATIFYQQHFAFSDETGAFTFENTGTKVKIMVTHLGYQPYEGTLDPDDEATWQIAMNSSVKMLEEVLITGENRPSVAQSRIDRQSIARDNPKNIGDIFKNKAGFGVIKRGGYAMDPVFRSFKYEQINLIYDGGVYISNACPNRMDPASTQMSTAEIDRIELVKGPYSVRYGQTMGALINIITNRPVSTDEFSISGMLEGGYESNGNGHTGRGAINLADNHYDLSVEGGTMSFDDYKNGEGEIVPSSFTNYNYTAKLGLNLSANQRIQLSWRQNFSKDVKHASLPMDSPKDNSTIVSMDYGARNLSNTLVSINAKVYYTYVDHLMTNENRPNFPMVFASSPVTSGTYGGRLEFGLSPNGKTTLFVGTDLRSVGKDGVRNRTVKIMNGTPLELPREFTDLIWQDSWLYDLGLFAEANWLVDEKWNAQAGARIDYVKSGANNPAADFEAYYGQIAPQDEINLSLTGSLNYHFAGNGLVQLSIGRGQRAADLLERYINHFSVGMDAYEYLGNPNLKSEVNNQIDLTVKNVHGNFHWSANIFYSYMQNYITAIVDESIGRKYMPGTMPLFTKRFINIDQAWQRGFDIEAGYRFGKTLTANVGIFCTKAQNVDFDEPLPEIPPLTGLLSVKYQQKQYFAELRGRLVDGQDRVADTFDEATSPGFEVFDLMAGYTLFKNMTIDFALKNILNSNYYEHLSRPYNNQGEAGMFYEPGRSVRIGLVLRF